MRVNKAQCKLCKTIIESKHRYQFVGCECGEIFVDGGLDYLRRLYKNKENFIDLSEGWEDLYPSRERNV